MKKVFTVIGIVALVIVTCGVIVGVLFYTGVFDKKADEQTVLIYTTEDGHKYTEVLWDWKPVEYKGYINYIDTSSIDKQTVSLHLEKDIYCDIEIPITEYVYDYGKTVWSVDGSYMIRVIGGATLDNLSALAGIDNGQALNQTTITTKEKQKGQRTIATFVDGYAIIANVYCNDEAYSILCDSLSSAKSYVADDVSYAGGYIALNKLSYTGEYIGQVVFQEVNLTQQKYMFADGILWSSSILEPLHEAKDEYLKRLCKASGGELEEMYNKDGMVYAKSGNYYLGLISYNTNTTIVLLGDGEESKCNIISVMHYLK